MVRHITIYDFEVRAILSQCDIMPNSERHQIHTWACAHVRTHTETEATKAPSLIDTLNLIKKTDKIVGFVDVRANSYFLLLKNH